MSLRLWINRERRFRKGARDSLTVTLEQDSFGRLLLEIQSSGTLEHPEERDRQGDVLVEIGDGHLDEVFEALALSERYGAHFKPETVTGIKFKKRIVD